MGNEDEEIIKIDLDRVLVGIPGTAVLGQGTKLSTVS